MYLTHLTRPAFPAASIPALLLAVLPRDQQSRIRVVDRYPIQLLILEIPASYLPLVIIDDAAPDPRLKRLPSTRKSSKRAGTFFKMLCPPSCCRDAAYTRRAHGVENHRLPSIIWQERGIRRGFDAAGAERLRWIAELSICNVHMRTGIAWNEAEGEARRQRWRRDEPVKPWIERGSARAMDETYIAMRFANRDTWACGFWISTDEEEDLGRAIQNGMDAASGADISGGGRGSTLRRVPGDGEAREKSRDGGKGGIERIHGWGRTKTERERETPRAGSAGLRVGSRARRRRRGRKPHARRHERCTAARGHDSGLGTAAKGRAMDPKKREDRGTDTDGVRRAGLESGIELGRVWSRAEDEALVEVGGGLETRRRDATMGTGAATR
ncbi:hypothetical protein DFH09DRAFT_1086927 [Mycena vulgaris]|nr:hypothetical protein DFH09DRAFT_1086927 [Mycena vulgaris]